MDRTIELVFTYFKDFAVGVVGSATWKDDPKDIDLLFERQNEFEDACWRLNLLPQCWDSHTGKICKADVKDIWDKPVQLLWNGSVRSLWDHPYEVLLRDGSRLNEGKHYVKEAGWTYKNLVKVDRRKESKLVVAIDFDGTIRDWDTSKPIPGAKNLINLLREKGVKVYIHSCNSPKFIEQWCNDYDIRHDGICPQDGGKPVAALYIDDRGFHFTGDYTKDTPEILKRLGL